MKNTCVNAYLFQAWLDLIQDSHLEAFIIIDPTRTSREIRVPMNYCINGFLTLNLAARALGYFNLDKETGYLMMSSRFNRIDQQMEIPVESIITIKSSCGTIALDMIPELQLIGDQLKQENTPSKTNSKKSTLTIVK